MENNRDIEMQAFGPQENRGNAEVRIAFVKAVFPRAAWHKC